MRKVMVGILVAVVAVFAGLAPRAVADEGGIYLEADLVQELTDAVGLMREDGGIYLEVPGFREIAASGVFDTYTLKEGEHLWYVASLRGVYGDPEMYPLLVDSNPQYFRATPEERVGMKLRIPRDLTEEVMSKAREAAWSVEYTSRMNIHFTQDQYRQFRAQLDSRYWMAKGLGGMVLAKK